MIRAVIDGFTGMSGQRTQQIHGGQAGFLRRFLKKRRLIEAGRSRRQPVLPDLRRRGNQPQQHLPIRHPGESVYITQVFFHLRVVRLLHSGNQRVAAEVHAMERPLPQKLFAPGFQAGPVIPQRELVGKIVLHASREAAVLQVFPGKLRELSQRAVFCFRPRPVWQRSVPDQQSRQKQAEHSRGQPSIFRHTAPSLPNQIRIGNTKTDYSCRPPDRPCRPPAPPASAPGQGHLLPVPAAGSSRSSPSG